MTAVIHSTKPYLEGDQDRSTAQDLRTCHYPASCCHCEVPLDMEIPSQHRANLIYGWKYDNIKHTTLLQ